LFNELNCRALIRLTTREKPDIVVCPHFLPGSVLAGLKAKLGFKLRIISVVTDFRTHSFWVHKEIDQYIVGYEETREDLISWGIEKEKIKVLGIPIGRAFSRKEDRFQLRKRLGLEPGLFTILIVSGGFGVGPMGRLVDELVDISVRTQVKFQLLVVCGHNRRLFRKFSNIHYPIGAFIFGFVNNMHELMQASDLLITKSGGLTISEALASGIVPLVIWPIPGQEENNARVLLKHNMAIKLDCLGQLETTIGRLFVFPWELAKIEENIRRLSRPGASEDIAELILNYARF
jgi:processive 1,2-diacylglycerol beta-glucosyltransferase